MDRNVESITETKEQVNTALGFKDPVTAEDKKTSVSEEAQAESDENNSEDSETLENQESTEDGDESDEVKDNGDEKSKPRKKRGFARKIGKLTAERDLLKQEIERLRSQPQQQNAQQDDSINAKKGIVQDQGAPKPENFETYGEYTDALFDYKLAKQKADEAKQADEKASKVRSDQINNDFSQRFEKYVDSLDDPDQFYEAINQAVVPNYVLEVVKLSEVAPELMHEMAKDKEFIQKLQNMDQYKAVVEIAKFEAKIQSKKTPEKQVNKVTKAPKPVSPIGSSSGGGSEKNPYEHEMSYQEHKAWMAKQKK